MVSLNNSLFTGLSGVRSAQVGLNVTGNNIANVNTPGYARQRPDIIPKGVQYSQNLTYGLGSDVNRIEAMRESLAEKAVTHYEASNSYYDHLSAGLQDLEGLMPEDENVGIRKALGEFFQGMEAATIRPTDTGVRRELLTLAEQLTDEINARDADLANEELRLNQEIDDLVSRVNDLTATIADINRKISSVSKPAEDLIDQRKNAIDELSQLVGVETFQLPNNQVQVNIQGSNQILIGREIRNTLSTQVDPLNNGYYDVNINVGGISTTITSTIQTGEMGAKLQLRDQEISAIRQDLDTLAAGLIIQFNTIHQTGTDLNGNTNLRLFDPDNATVLGATAIGTIDPARYQGVAGTISLSTDLVDPLNPGAGFDPTRLALSATGAVGDNGTGLALANLRDNQNVIDQDLDGDPTNDPTVGYEKFYGGVLTELGRRVKTEYDQALTHEELLNQANIRREEASGVNLDEEAVNLTQYQRAFEASSRFINVVNQLTGEILARLGS